jgi:hypothetical protein
MKINIYYEFPHPNTLLEGGTKSSWVHNLSNLSDMLIEKYPNINFEKKQRWSGAMGNLNPWDGTEPFDKNKHATISDTILIIENDENKKYFVISIWDKGYYELNSWSDLKEKCVEIFAICGMHLDDRTYKLSPMKYTPLNFPPNIFGEEKIIDELYYENLKNNKRIIPEKLFFQSLVPYLFREYIHNHDNRFDSVIGYNSEIREWLNKLSRYKINIDINCVGEPSGRGVEILGLGSVLLRPKLSHQFQNPLIPNYHYIEVEHEFYDPIIHGDDINVKYYKSLADAYIDTFEKVKGNNDLINFISKNGREYYENYCITEKWLNTTLGLIDLNKLK